jgi:predicted naringenin-chalcone synthase
MSFCIAGLGTAVPREMISQDDAARLAIQLAGTTCNRGAAIQTLYRKAGVKKRHSALLTSSTNGHPAAQYFFSVATDSTDRGPSTGERMRRYESVAVELAAQAARDALRECDTDPHEITDLVTVSCTGFSAPGVDVGLMQQVGLKRGISRTHVGFMGCHGALNGLRVASALSRSARARKVLLSCVELCSVHHQYSREPQQIVANSLFGDGAAAIVGVCDAADDAWRVIDQFSCVLPDTSYLMAWRIGDNGFEMRLSPQVPSVIERTLRPWLGEQLARHDLLVDDVKGWAIHPGGPRILTACANAIGFDHTCLRPSQQVLSEFGNMSSPTVLFILERLRAQGDCLPCVVMAFGPGLTIEAALIA